MIDLDRSCKAILHRLRRSNSNALVSSVVQTRRLELRPRAWRVLFVGCLMLEVSVVLASPCMDTNLDCNEWALEGMCDDSANLEMQNWCVQVCDIVIVTPIHRMRASCAYSCGLCREQPVPVKSTSKAPVVRPVARSPSLQRGCSEEL